jgi:hypothetical protein
MQNTEGVPVYQDPRNEVMLRGIELMMSSDPSAAAALWSLVVVEDERSAEAKRRAGMGHNGPPRSGR